MGRGVRAVLMILVLLLGVVGPRPASPPVASAASFCDVAPGAAYYEAVTQLAARGIIGGYENGCFGPNDPTNRAQMAALIARAMGWAGEDRGNQFADRCDPIQGCVDDNLWRNVGTLQYRQVARGYDATTYGPHNLVVQQQVLLFISRAMVQKGAWQRQADNPAVYPNLPRGTDAERRDAADIATYVHYVGSAPDAPSGISWTTYGQASARAWFARALWQVLAKFPVGPAPSAPPSGPTLGVSPSSGVAGTQFAASVSGAPAGATIAWAFTYGGAQTNSGTFALNPGQTAFTFTADSTGSNAGLWTLTFWANGARLGAVTYTVTASRDNYVLKVEYDDNCILDCRPGNTMWVTAYLTNNGVGVPGATMTSYWTISGEIAPPFQGNPSCSSYASGANGGMGCGVTVPPVSYCAIWGNSVYIDISVRYGTQTFRARESVMVRMDCD